MASWTFYHIFPLAWGKDHTLPTSPASPLHTGKAWRLLCLFLWYPRPCQPRRMTTVTISPMTPSGSAVCCAFCTSSFPYIARESSQPRWLQQLPATCPPWSVPLLILPRHPRAQVFCSYEAGKFSFLKHTELLSAFCLFGISKEVSNVTEL